MLLKISKLSEFSKKYWDFVYKNEDFDDILNLVLNKMNYDHIELTLWSFQTKLLNTIEHTRLVNKKRFSTLRLDKVNSIKLMNSKVFNEIRLFEIVVCCGNENFFRFTSDNYGEHTSITMNKSVEISEVSKLLLDIFA